MLQGIYYLSDLYLFLFLIAFFIALSIVSLWLVGRFIPMSIRYRENAVIAAISALISIIYGVLVGLMALFLMNNINAASDAVLQEGNAVADLYRYSRWLDDPARTNIQNDLKVYLTEAIKVEWPLMKVGKDIDQKGHYLIHNITNELIHYQTKTTNEGLVLHDMLDEVKELFDSRSKRIQMSMSELNMQIWVVVIIGTLLIVIINFFYGLNVYMHIAMSCGVAVMAASMIFLLITLDRPFQGEFGIEPMYFENLLSFMNSQKPNHDKTQKDKIPPPSNVNLKTILN